MKKKLFGSQVRDDFGDVFSDLSEGELLDHGASSGKFLDEFTKEEVQRLLVECGVFATIKRKRGLADIYLSLDLSDAYVHKLYLHSSKTDEPLCELFLRVTTSTDNFRALDDTSDSGVTAGANFVKSWAKTHGPLRMLVIEWMLLQDPFKSAAGVKLLPGQKMIGLGCAQEVVTFIRKLADGLGVHGLMNKPLYFHNAFLYSPLYTFLNPEIEASFRLLVSDLDGDIREQGLGAVSHAINYGALKHRSSGAVVAWTHEEQVRPLGSKLEGLFGSPAFRSLLRTRMGDQVASHSEAGPPEAETATETVPETSTGTETGTKKNPVSGEGVGQKTATESRPGMEGEREPDPKPKLQSKPPFANDSQTAPVDDLFSMERGNAHARHEIPPASVAAKRADLQRAESMAYENAAGGSEADLQAVQATNEQPREASMSLFKTVLDEFIAKKRAPSSREPIFEIDWELPVEDRASVEDRLRHAVPFKEFRKVR